MHDAALVDRLAGFDALRACPRAELEWLVEHGEYRQCAAGDVVLSATDESQEMIVQLSGRIVVYYGHGAGRRHVAESKGGNITGLLPFSRLKRPPTDVLVEESADFLAIHRRQFPEMIRTCPVLVESLVHTMLDRVRRFAADDWQDEKVMSLGRLAAGLAHELNNPAAAASSGAASLATALREVGKAAHEFGMTTVDPATRALVVDVVGRCDVAQRAMHLSAVERLDLEDRVAEWLTRYGMKDDNALVLAEGAVTMETLEQLAGSLSGEALQRAVNWIAASAAAALAIADVRFATRRVHDVVSAVRDFSHMDRAAVREPTDVAQGLADTVNVIRHGAKANGVTLTLDIEPSLPRVAAVAPDLNQVWLHLIENALHAVGRNAPTGSPGNGERGAHVAVVATLESRTVVVTIRDNGPGIPEPLQSRIFDPFFTTKPVGEGIGLGLDSVRRTVRHFDGEVEFDSQPGRTEFRVRLPALSV